MSHDYGEVIVNGKVVGYFVYYGTTDYAISKIYDSAEESSNNWRNHIFQECTCGEKSIDAILWTSYGGKDGFHWNGKVCLICKAITEGFEPFGWFFLDEYAGFCSGQKIYTLSSDGRPMYNGYTLRTALK